MSRQDKFLITVTVGGVPYGIWDKSTGGERDSDETKYRSGGQPNQVALGGPGTVSNVTAERRFLAERDMAVLKTLMPLAGKTRATLTKQPAAASHSARCTASSRLPWKLPKLSASTNVPAMAST